MKKYRLKRWEWKPVETFKLVSNGGFIQSQEMMENIEGCICLIVLVILAIIIF